MDYATAFLLRQLHGLNELDSAGVHVTYPEGSESDGIVKSFFSDS